MMLTPRSIQILADADAFADANADTDASALLLNVTMHAKEEAERVAKKVRVLCWIMTGPDNHKTKVKVTK